jgi:hypothetical protein
MRLGHVMQGVCSALAGLAVLLAAVDLGWQWWGLLAAFAVGSAVTFGAGWALDRFATGRTR